LVFAEGIIEKGQLAPEMHCNCGFEANDHFSNIPGNP